MNRRDELEHALAQAMFYRQRAKAWKALARHYRDSVFPQFLGSMVSGLLAGLIGERLQTPLPLPMHLNDGGRPLCGAAAVVNARTSDRSRVTCAACLDPARKRETSDRIRALKEKLRGRKAT